MRMPGLGFRKCRLVNVWSITSGYMYSRRLTTANEPGGLSTTWDWRIRRSVGPLDVHALRARRIAKGTTLPILVAGSDVIQGSGLILDWTGMPGSAPGTGAAFRGAGRSPCAPIHLYRNAGCCGFWRPRRSL